MTDICDRLTDGQRNGEETKSPLRLAGWGLINGCSIFMFFIDCKQERESEKIVNRLSFEVLMYFKSKSVFTCSIFIQGGEKRLLVPNRLAGGDS